MGTLPDSDPIPGDHLEMESGPKHTQHERGVKGWRWTVDIAVDLKIQPRGVRGHCRGSLYCSQTTSADMFADIAADKTAEVAADVNITSGVTADVAAGVAAVVAVDVSAAVLRHRRQKASS